MGLCGFDPSKPFIKCGPLNHGPPSTATWLIYIRGLTCNTIKHPVTFIAKLLIETKSHSHTKSIFLAFSVSFITLQLSFKLHILLSTLRKIEKYIVFSYSYSALLPFTPLTAVLLHVQYVSLCYFKTRKPSSLLGPKCLVFVLDIQLWRLW